MRTSRPPSVRSCLVALRVLSAVWYVIRLSTSVPVSPCATGAAGSGEIAANSWMPVSISSSARHPEAGRERVLLPAVPSVLVEQTAARTAAGSKARAATAGDHRRASARRERPPCAYLDGACRSWCGPETADSVALVTSVNHIVVHKSPFVGGGRGRSRANRGSDPFSSLRGFVQVEDVDDGLLCAAASRAP